MKTYIRGQHIQHSVEFKRNLNSTNNTKLLPFRTFDEVWTIGKYKGSKLKDTPTSYIKWVLNTMNISENSAATLKQYI